MNDILKELEEAFYDIPFENSAYQNETFVMAAQITPGRAYRALGLKMFSKLRAIDELKFARELENVDVAELKEQAKGTTSTKHDKARALIKIRQICSKRKWEDKLLNDALAEMNSLYALFKKYPQYTREQFEQEERDHFLKKLSGQVAAAGSGALESLQAMEVRESNNLIGEVANVRISS